MKGYIKQFYTEVNYGDLDYLFIDMPPGTADVGLTVFQSLNLSGIIIVTTPQDLVNEIVSKAIEMANTMNIKVLGIIENMSYLECPDCGKHIPVFGDSHLDEFAKKENFKILPIQLNSKKLFIPPNSGRISPGKTEKERINLINKMKLNIAEAGLYKRNNIGPNYVNHIPDNTTGKTQFRNTVGFAYGSKK